jgi:hypothetical protein
MANYPTSIFEPREVENLPGYAYDSTKKRVQFAEDYTYPAEEIVAIEETLGINPQGSYATVAERLDAGTGASLELGIYGGLSFSTFNILPEIFGGTADEVFSGSVPVVAGNAQTVYTLLVLIDCGGAVQV